MSQPEGSKPDATLAELMRLVRSTRELVDGAAMPADAAVATVMFMTYILLAKNRGLPREAVHKVLDDVWNLDEATR